ncbi:MAG: DegT/DnrJ/EryC1/StrS family aminotransferase [Alphaproteobacteria bacterium]
MPFIDLQAQRARIGDAIDAAIARVLEHGRFILGPEVAAFEERLAAENGVSHVVSCANGTDALQLGLRALDIGPGDAVFVPAFTFAATAEIVCLVGATPVFVDIERDSYNMDPHSLDSAIAATLADGALQPAGIIPVDLFGNPANYPAIQEVADKHDLWVFSDAAQSMGARLGATAAGAHGRMAATSFFPAKPLGAYGDGGAILTNDDTLAAALRSLRMHGQGRDKYDNVVIGTNSRLDTIQAAILIEKLSILGSEIDARQAVAQRYSDALADIADVPVIADDAVSAWAQYTIRIAGRDPLQKTLKDQGIPTAIYYPNPLPRLTAYTGYPLAPGGIPVSDAAAAEVISLPMHPYLDAATQDRIIAAVRTAAADNAA